MSKPEIKLNNFDFAHLEASTGTGPKGVAHFVTVDDVVVVDPAGTAFKGSSDALNLVVGVSGASKSIYDIAPHRPNTSDATNPAKIKGAVTSDAAGIVTTISSAGAVLNLQNLSTDGKKGAIIHAVGPQFEKRKSEETDAHYAARKDKFAKDLQETFVNILKLWQEELKTKDKNLYLPFISAGIFGGHHLGDEYFKIFVEQLEAAMVVAKTPHAAINRIKIVPDKTNTRQPIAKFFQAREAKQKMEVAKKVVIDSMEKGYEEYLARALTDNTAAKANMIAEITAAKHVVIEQGQHGAARTNQQDLIKRLYKAADTRAVIDGKQVIALTNDGNGVGGHWTYITSAFNAATKAVSFAPTSISGAGLACGAYTVMRILGQTLPFDAVTFVNQLTIFTPVEKAEINAALNLKTDLTKDGGILARRFVAEIVKAQMASEGKPQNEIDAAVIDIMTKQIEQENLSRAFKHFKIAVVRRDQIVQATPSATAGRSTDVLSFEKWVSAKYFADGQTATEARDELEATSNSLGVNGKALLAELKGQFKQAKASNISVAAILAQPNQAAREKEEIDGIVATAKLLQAEYHSALASTPAPAATPTPASNPNNDEITKKTKRDFWFLFPTVESLTPLCKQNAQAPKKILQALAQDANYAKNYVANVKQYLSACGYDCAATPPIVNASPLISVDEKRFDEVVGSFIQLTVRNRLTLEGILPKDQKELLMHLHEFAKATNQAENPVVKKLEKMLEPEKVFVMTTVKADQEDHNNPLFVKEGKLYATTSNQAGKKEAEVAGAGVYYKVTVDATTGIATTKFFTEEDVAADDTKATKSWRGDAMDYYLNKIAKIPDTAVKVMSVISVLESQNSRSGGRKS